MVELDYFIIKKAWAIKGKLNNQVLFYKHFILPKHISSLSNFDQVAHSFEDLRAS